MITVDRRALARELIAALNDDPTLRSELISTLRATANDIGQLVTVGEYARQKSISCSTVRAAIREGRLKAVRIGRAVRIPIDADLGVQIACKQSANTTSARADRILGLVGGQR
jgi:excisionase family DNA binding protein